MINEINTNNILNYKQVSSLLILDSLLDSNVKLNEEIENKFSTKKDELQASLKERIQITDEYWKTIKLYLESKKAEQTNVDTTFDAMETDNLTNTVHSDTASDILKSIKKIQNLRSLQSNINSDSYNYIFDTKLHKNISHIEDYQKEELDSETLEEKCEYLRCFNDAVDKLLFGFQESSKKQLKTEIDDQESQNLYQFPNLLALNFLKQFGLKSYIKIEGTTLDRQTSFVLVLSSLRDEKWKIEIEILASNETKELVQKILSYPTNFKRQYKCLGCCEIEHLKSLVNSNHINIQTKGEINDKTKSQEQEFSDLNSLFDELFLSQKNGVVSKSHCSDKLCILRDFCLQAIKIAEQDYCQFQLQNIRKMYGLTQTESTLKVVDKRLGGIRLTISIRSQESSSPCYFLLYLSTKNFAIGDLNTNDVKDDGNVNNIGKQKRLEIGLRKIFEEVNIDNIQNPNLPNKSLLEFLQYLSQKFDELQKELDEKNENEDILRDLSIE